jgi:hypothetical protein
VAQMWYIGRIIDGCGDVKDLFAHDGRLRIFDYGSRALLHSKLLFGLAGEFEVYWRSEKDR